MNYRHAFHAGNFADVFKHVLLSRILAYLSRKETPFRYIDTHAGVGRYDLSGEEAQRTQEWRGGVGRVLSADMPPHIRELLTPWLMAVGERDEEGMPLSYPGSPALAQYMLRSQDKMTFCELHPKDVATLGANMGRDRRMKILELDGYMALRAYVPPVERRGLVMVDPPFENVDEFDVLAQNFLEAWRKWPTGTYALWHPVKDSRLIDNFYFDLRKAGVETGVYALWHPVKDSRLIDNFYFDLRKAGVERLLRLELTIAAPTPDGRLVGTGLCVVNPPHVLAEEARILLPWLANRMALEADGKDARFMVKG